MNTPRQKTRYPRILAAVVVCAASSSVSAGSIIDNTQLKADGAFAFLFKDDGQCLASNIDLFAASTVGQVQSTNGSDRFGSFSVTVSNRCTNTSYRIENAFVSPFAVDTRIVGTKSAAASVSGSYPATICTTDSDGMTKCSDQDGNGNKVVVSFNVQWTMAGPGTPERLFLRFQDSATTSIFRAVSTAFPAIVSGSIGLPGQTLDLGSYTSLDSGLFTSKSGSLTVAH